jgi:SAM-dependent methyltransferase
MLKFGLMRLVKIPIRILNSILRFGDSKKNTRLNHVEHWSRHGATPYFRKNQKRIKRGEIPFRYSRIVPYVSGINVLDLGCGEGLLPLMLANPKKVVGIDVSPKRINIANKLLHGAYSSKKGFVSFVSGDATKYVCSSQLPETIVMNRVLYHFARDVSVIRDAMRDSGTVTEIVLIGNRDKKNLTSADHDLGEWIYYSTVEGMSQFLKEAGFADIEVAEIPDYDPIVVGRREIKTFV